MEGWGSDPLPSIPPSPPPAPLVQSTRNKINVSRKVQCNSDQYIPVYINPIDQREDKLKNFELKSKGRPVQKRVKKTIRRSQKVVDAQSLPIISVYNMRSIWSKFDNLVKDMNERKVELTILSEIWEHKENQKHQDKIRDMCQSKNLQYFSMARPKAKRGGGCGILVKGQNFVLSPLSISVPKSLEVCWGLLRPNKQIGNIKKIIICAFYSPPHSTKNNELVKHITFNYNHLKILHPSAKTLIIGDRNDLKILELVKISTSFQQVVDKPTRKGRILDIIVTDMWNLYQSPIIVPPIQVDLKAVASGAKPSDHDGVVIVPVTSVSDKSIQSKQITVRRMPESQINSFGRMLVKEKWEFMLSEKENPTELVNKFDEYNAKVIDAFFPTKNVKVSKCDKAWMNQQLKNLRRQKQREYRKKGISPKYEELERKFEEIKRKEIGKQRERILKSIKEGSTNKAYKALRKLGTEMEENEDFLIPVIDDENVAPKEAAEKLAAHFVSISSSIDPLNIDSLPINVQNVLSDSTGGKDVSEYEVYIKIKKAKKPNSMVKSDVPPKLVKEFAVEYAKPVQVIFNAITKSGEYPRQWVMEEQVAIPKCLPIKDFDSLRPLSKTNFFSKCYESLLRDWLLPVVQPFLDPANYGGMKGSSTMYYILHLLHFIHTHVDSVVPQAVLLAQADLQKAFMNVSHQNVIIDLHDMQVPGWLLRILASYLTGRSMVLKFRGAESSRFSLPASTPQGTFLGIFLFIISFNGAFLRPNIPRTINLCNNCVKFSKKTNCIHMISDSFTAKFVDDSSRARKVNLTTDLTENNNKILPLNFHERTGHKIKSDANLLEKDLEDFLSFLEEKNQKINYKKSTIMLFNFSQKYDFDPRVSIGECELKVVTTTRILGINLQDNLKWDSHINDITSRAASKLFLVKKMMNNDFDIHFMIDFYNKEIRSVLEYGAVLYHHGLTKSLSDQIEAIQRHFLKLLSGHIRQKFSFMEASIYFHVEPLILRRHTLCVQFIKKTLKSDLYSDSFVSRANDRVLPRQRKYQEFRSHHERHFQSPLVALTRMANKLN